MRNEPIVRFRRAFDAAPMITRAEKSAGGVLPTAAFQYCEAARQAAGFGWYVFPPKDIHLVFDGKEVFYHEQDQWFPVKTTSLGEEFEEKWRQTAPSDLGNMFPPFLSEIFVPGVVQIWSGYFVETAPDWSVLVRPPANYDSRSSFSCFEGIVETDSFKPWPLFINLKLHATDREIFIPSYKPLFQVQPLQRPCYTEASERFEVDELVSPQSDSFDWEGFRLTVRDTEHRNSRRPGSYAAAQRKRA